MDEVEAGRLWKARDRLHGAFVSAPADQALLNLLGEVLFQMGDHPAAAKYWLLTTRDDEDAAKAEAALLEIVGRPARVALFLPVRAELHEYPLAVQERLRGLRSLAISELGPNAVMPWGRRNREVDQPLRPSRWRGVAAALTVTVIATVLLVALIRGLVSLVIDAVEGLT